MVECDYNTQTKQDIIQVRKSSVIFRLSEKVHRKMQI